MDDQAKALVDAQIESLAQYTALTAALLNAGGTVDSLRTQIGVLHGRLSAVEEALDGLDAETFDGAYARLRESSVLDALSQLYGPFNLNPEDFT